MQMNEIEGTRPNSCPKAFAEIKTLTRGEDFKNGFQIFQFRLNFTGSKT